MLSGMSSPSTLDWSDGDHASAQLELDDARESLTYWEQRAASLPLRAVRERREARDMAVRWHHRVARAERDAYGRGLVGLLVLLLSEGRLPEPARHTGRRVVRRATQIGIAVVVAVVALVLTGLVAGIALLAAFLDGLL